MYITVSENDKEEAGELCLQGRQLPITHYQLPTTNLKSKIPSANHLKQRYLGDCRRVRLVCALPPR